MQIIKDKQIVDDTWVYLADDAELKTDGNITVSLSRWNQDKKQILSEDRNIGIRLSSADSVDEIVHDLNYIKLIELDFPGFGDGRLFSLAWLLRARYHYQGEIRATGQFMPDQVFYLSRVGVNAFTFLDPEKLTEALSTLNDFTVNYQQSIA